jgi:hypothetical protein
MLNEKPFNKFFFRMELLTFHDDIEVNHTNAKNACMSITHNSNTLSTQEHMVMT